MSAEYDDLRDIRLTFIGAATVNLTQCPPDLVEAIVDDLVAIMRRETPNRIYTINRPLLGPQIFDATNIVAIEVLGGPGVGRWAA
jgi:hypothetical protein